MKYPRIRSKTVIPAAIAIGMFLSLTTARSEATTIGGGSPEQQHTYSAVAAASSTGRYPGE
jgi:hypothetical protein